jgi:hypothetical protein
MITLFDLQRRKKKKHIIPIEKYTGNYNSRAVASSRHLSIRRVDERREE